MLGDALRELALVIAITIVVFVALRRIGKGIYRRMGASAGNGGFAQTATLYLASGLIDALIVILAWAAGYAIALSLLGEFGQIGIRQTLYLNAFLLVEMAKVLVRLVPPPTAGNLRPIPLGDAAARYLASRPNLIVSIVGYGQLLVVPILNANISFAAGNAMPTLISFLVLAILVWLVLRNRKAVTDWLLGTDTAAPADAPRPVEAPVTTHRRGALAFLARHWHWPALVYLFAMFFVVLLRPGDAVFQAFLASGQVLLLGLLGLALSGLLGGVIARGINLPGDISARLPLLETRLNRFVPRMLFALRLAIFLLVTLPRECRRGEAGDAGRLCGTERRSGLGREDHRRARMVRPAELRRQRGGPARPHQVRWGVGREYNAILKRIFDARGIEIPFPHQTIFLGEAKDGETQRFKVGIDGTD